MSKLNLLRLLLSQQTLLKPLTGLLVFGKTGANTGGLSSNFADFPPHILIASPEALNDWLSKFVLEVKRKYGKPYPPNTLHQLVCGLLRYARETNPSIDFFKDKLFASFRRTLDAEMKRLRSCGIGVTTKRAEPITPEEEEAMWKCGVLGSDSPQTLIDTIFYMCGLYFALRSGQEHRQLLLNQVELLENGEQSCIVYTENVSKNNPGGLQHRKVKAKQVTQYANLDNPECCFITLFKKYCSRRPSGLPHFYLTPIKGPKTNIWYAKTPIGHHKLDSTISRMCKAANIPGFKTNHSLRVSAATRLFQKGVDEQLIMERTGHRSLDGVRTYKRVSSQQHRMLSGILNLSSEEEPSPKVPKLSEKENSPPEPEAFSKTTLPVCSAYNPAPIANKQDTVVNIPPNPLPTLSFTGCSGITINYNGLK